MGFTDEMKIDCPSTTVFDLLADARNETRWNSTISKVELTTAEPIRKGSTFNVVSRGKQHEVTITVFDRPERLEFALAGKEMDVDIAFTFTEAEGTTTAVGVFEAQPKGFMKLILPLLMPMIRRDVAKQHVEFKRLCEAQAE